MLIGHHRESINNSRGTGEDTCRLNEITRRSHLQQPPEDATSSSRRCISNIFEGAWLARRAGKKVLHQIRTSHIAKDNLAYAAMLRLHAKLVELRSSGVKVTVN